MPFEHGAHHIDRRGRARLELGELSVLHEEQELEQRRVVVMRRDRSRESSRRLCLRSRRLVRGQRLQRRAEGDIVSLECSPHEFVFAASKWR